MTNGHPDPGPREDDPLARAWGALYALVLVVLSFVIVALRWLTVHWA